MEKTIPKVMQNLENAQKTEKRKLSKPWAPSHLLKVSGKVPGYRYRMCSMDAMNLQKKLDEGWEIVKKGIDGKHESISNGTLMDGSQLDNTIRKRNLILMRMPEELAKSREEYYSQLNKAAVPNKVKDLKEEAKKANVEVYGDVKITMPKIESEVIKDG